MTEVKNIVVGNLFRNKTKAKDGRDGVGVG